MGQWRENIVEALADSPWDDSSKRILMGVLRVLLSVTAIMLGFYLGMFLTNFIVSLLSIPGGFFDWIFQGIFEGAPFWDFVMTAIGSGWVYLFFAMSVFLFCNLSTNTLERLVVLIIAVTFIIFIYDIRISAPIKMLHEARSYLIDEWGFTLWKTVEFLKFTVSDSRYLVFDLAVIAAAILSVVDRSKD